MQFNPFGLKMNINDSSYYEELIILIGVYLRILICTIASFHGPLIGSTADAFAFHEEALSAIGCDFANGFRVGWFYSDILGCMYGFVYPNQFIGALSSVAFWAASAICTLIILRELEVNRLCRLYALCFFSFMPSSLFFSSVTLRESLELLCVSIFFLGIIKTQNKNHLFWWITCLVAFLISSLLHKAFMIGFAVTGLFIFFSFFLKLKLKFTLLVLIFVVIIALWEEAMINYIFHHLEGLKNFREKISIKNARTDYIQDVKSIHSNFEFLVHLAISYIQYFVEPLPWKIKNFFDFECFLENLLRIYLLLMSLYYFLSKNFLSISKELTIFLGFIFIEFTWSLGTGNWGTAWRHHHPQFGLLIVCYFSLASKNILQRNINSGFCNDK
jgi:hypothetical protein